MRSIEKARRFLDEADKRQSVGMLNDGDRARVLAEIGLGYAILASLEGDEDTPEPARRPRPGIGPTETKEDD